MEDFTENVKSWVKIDNKLKELNAEVKEIRDKKNDIQQNIMSYVQKMGMRLLSYFPKTAH
jgi:uncharacterized coiled-coil DUF342 family protein